MSKYREFPIFRLYFDDFSNFTMIFWPTDYRLAISFLGPPITDISAKKIKILFLGYDESLLPSLGIFVYHVNTQYARMKWYCVLGDWTWLDKSLLPRLSL